VQLADTSGDWNYCDVVEGVMDKQSHLPEDFLQRVVKSVMRMEALDKSTPAAKQPARKRQGNAHAPSHTSGTSGFSRKGDKSRGRSSSRGPSGRGSSGAPAGAGKQKSSSGTARGGSEQE